LTNTSLYWSVKVQFQTACKLIAALPTSTPRPTIRLDAYPWAEVGRAIIDAKAHVLARLCSQPKREIQMKRRARSRLKPSRIAAARTAARAK
jgi:hypothetical protein